MNVKNLEGGFQVVSQISGLDAHGRKQSKRSQLFVIVLNIFFKGRREYNGVHAKLRLGHIEFKVILKEIYVEITKMHTEGSRA